MTDKPALSRVINQTQEWLSQQLAPRDPKATDEVSSARPARRARLIAICACVFLLALGVRLLHWQDEYLSANITLGSLTHRYEKQAAQMLDGEGILFPRDFQMRENVQQLIHPPGYPIFIAAIYATLGRSDNLLTIAQIIADTASAVIASLITAELFPLAVAALAGLLIAFSPHLAHYSLFLLPDSLVALPILIAVYLIIRASKRPRLITIIAAGVMIGLSCWLRSNGLLLALFVAAAIFLLFERGKRLRYSFAMIAATIITISPITIRNAVVYHHFIPLSLGAGITMIEGIADYDREKRFGMPASDLESKLKDIEWHNRPDYGQGLWKPDGIYRDQYRFRRGLEVIRSHPVWFAGVMLRRAAFMLRYNSSTSEGWPFDTAHVPVVSLEPSFGHQLATASDAEPVWTSSASELKADGQAIAPQAEAVISADGTSLEIAGDNSEFADQFASAPIQIEKSTDYLLRLSAKLLDGRAAAKVTSSDRRITLASAFIEKPEERTKRKAKDEDDTDADDSTDESGASPGEEEAASTPVFEMPFASGNRSEALLVISNNGPSQSRPKVEITRAELYRLGPTPHLWTRV
ncbi:MAG TPA: glycosyltransferase family 39 protein, partial [Blastocatellia bacterium]|nr:glycosyltransferase family 39 protein [Blastocatellia bacterium]